MTNEQTKMILDWIDSKLAGKKTYLAAIVGIIYYVGAGKGWWPKSDEIAGILTFAGIGFLRAGVGRQANQSSDADQK